VCQPLPTLDKLRAHPGEGQVSCDPPCDRQIDVVRTVNITLVRLAHAIGRIRAASCMASYTVSPRRVFFSVLNRSPSESCGRSRPCRRQGGPADAAQSDGSVRRGVRRGCVRSGMVPGRGRIAPTPPDHGSRRQGEAWAVRFSYTPSFPFPKSKLPGADGSLLKFLNPGPSPRIEISDQ
jgi:hypothetical protein